MEGEPDQIAERVRQDTANSQKSSRTHALPAQRWHLPSPCRPSAFQQWVRGRLRTVIDETEVLVRVEKAVEGVEQRLLHFAQAQTDRQPDGQVPPRNQHDEQCSSGLRKSATGGRKDVP